MKYRHLVIAVALVSLGTFGSAHASVSNGTITSGDNLTEICQDTACATYGIVNWKPTLNANTDGATAVAITDTGITGWIWGDEIGWINLQPTGAGVTVDPNTGALSGDAWATVGSWINFSPITLGGGTNVGVSINSQGQFVGWAYVSGIDGGWMKFDCSSGATCIQTDWRPIPDRSSGSGGGGSSGGGGGGGTGPVSGGQQGGGTTVTTTTTTTGSGSTSVPPVDTSVVPPIETPDYVDNNTPPNSSSVTSTSVTLTQTNTPPPIIATGTGVPPQQQNSAVIYIQTPDTLINFFAVPQSFSYVKNSQGQNLSVPAYYLPGGRLFRLTVTVPHAPKTLKATLLFQGVVTSETRPTVGPMWSIVDSILDIFDIGKLLNLFHISSAHADTITNTVTSTTTVENGDTTSDTATVNPSYAQNLSIPNAPGLYRLDVVASTATSSVTTSSYVVVPQNGQVTSVTGLWNTVISVPATVSLYQKDPASGISKLWQGASYNQQNPQQAGQDGAYVFIVPPGTYNLAVTAQGYRPFETGDITVATGSPVINDKVVLSCVFWDSVGCSLPTKVGGGVVILISLLIWVTEVVLRRRNR